MENKKLLISRIDVFAHDRLALIIGCLFALILVTYPIHDLDLYWHLANGREMVNAGRVISKEMFSYTHFGEPFTNHEWLSQIILYLVWNNLGPYGLFGFKLLVTSLIVLLLFRGIRATGGQPELAAMLCVFAVLAGLPRYVERPELFSLLNTALLSYILNSFRANHISHRLLWLIPLIFIVWDWLHGAVYGLVFLTLFVTGENAKHFVPVLRNELSLSRDNLNYLNSCFAIVILAMLVNPFGLRTYGIFVEFISNKNVIDAASQIKEYMPISWTGFKPYILMLAWAVMLMLRHIRRIDITQLLILLVFGYAACRYRRAIGVSGIVLAPIIASLITYSMQHAKNELEKKLHFVTMILIVVFIACYSYNEKFLRTTPLSFGDHVYEDNLPVGSVRFIKAMDLTGNLYNNGDFGSYLSYYITPERKIFQYNLPRIFGDSFRFPDHPEELSKWNINYAIVGTYNELNILFPEQFWARIYSDPKAVLVLKRTPENQRLINLYEIRYFHREVTYDELRTMASNTEILPRLTYEMGVYLAYRHDEPIALYWEKILAARTELRKQPQIQQLLKQALIYNYSDKLAELVK